MSIESHEFNSGLRVFSDHIPSAHISSINFIVNVGSIDESDDDAGLSHLLEHSVFNGSKLFETEELRREYEWNNMYTSDANTGQNRTFFEASGPNGDEMINGLGSVVFDPLLRASDLETELSIVKREAHMRSGWDSERFMYADRQSSLEFPYSRPIIGFYDELQFTNEDLIRHYEKGYKYGSITLVTAGKLTCQQVVDLVIGNWPSVDETEAGPLVAEARPLPVIKHPGKFWYADNSQGENIEIGTRVVMNPQTAKNIRESDDGPAYVVAGQLINEAVTNEIRERQGLSYDGWFGIFTSFDEALCNIGSSVTVAKDDFSKVTSLIDGIVRDAPNKFDINKANRMVKLNLGGIYAGLDSIEARAFIIHDAVEQELPIKSHADLLKAYQELDGDVVKTAMEDLARQYSENERKNLYRSAEPPTDDCTEISPRFTRL